MAQCKIHNQPFVLRPGGVSKNTGKTYSGFWACPGKTPDGKYCKEKPDATPTQTPAPAQPASLIALSRIEEGQKEILASLRAIQSFLMQ